MFCTVLVPLDGSPFAEQALPHALGIVPRAGATLDLVHVHVLYAVPDPAYGRYAYAPKIDEELRIADGGIAGAGMLGPVFCV